MIVAPATFNTINKWVAGISDTLALGLLTEAIGKALPLVALPFLNVAQARHPAFGRSVDQLREAGVKVLLGPDVYQLHEPGTGSRYLDTYRWNQPFRLLAGELFKHGVGTIRAGDSGSRITTTARRLQSALLPMAELGGTASC
jgi:phosphopantothenoylcysteine synthetase/decarboxylase